MMADHLSVEEINQYRERRLSANRIVAVGEHLSVCADCRMRLGSAAAVDAVYAVLGPELEESLTREPAHLLDDQLAAYVDGSMDEVDFESVESHLELCARCRIDVKGLREIRAALDGQRAGSQPRRALSGRPIAGVTVLLRVAAALVIVLLAATVLMTWNQTRALRAEVSQLQRQNEEFRGIADELAKAREQIAQLEHQMRRGAESQPVLAVALEDSGGTVGLSKEGNVIGFAALTPEQDRLIKRALEGGAPATPGWLSELVGRDRPLMSPDKAESFPVLSPVATVVVSDRPTFRWRGLEGASKYRVVVTDSSYTQVAASEEISGTEWTPPGSLPRGRLLIWEVTAFRDGRDIVAPSPPAPQARFRVLDLAAAEGLERARRTYGESHVLMGVLYANAGLLDDAEREFGAVAGANPNSAIAQRILKNVTAVKTKARGK